MMSHGSKHSEQRCKPIAIEGGRLYELRPDIDERLAVERLACIAPPVLEEVTAGVVHDFRNILATIDSCLRLADRCLDEPEKILNFLAGARDGVRRGLRLTSQFLALAQRGEVQTRAADANLLLGNLESFLRYAAGSSVRVVFDLCPIFRIAV